MKFIKKQFNRIYRLYKFIKRGPQPSIGNYLRQTKYHSTFNLINNRQIVAGNEWDDFRLEIINELKRSPESFLRQPVISKTIHPNQQKLAQDYLNDLAASEFARSRILPKLNDMPIGDPYLCEFFPLASPMSMQHAYYIYLIHKKLNIFIPESGIDHILELGGGYGNFFRLIRNYGYLGKYTIIDLPEMHNIQRYYLSNIFSNITSNKIIEFKSINDLENMYIQKLSIFIATFSLNEMPIESRKKIEQIINSFDYIFIAFNSFFSGINNLDYFEDLKNRFSKDFTFKLIKDDHRLAWFLIGNKIH